MWNLNQTMAAEHDYWSCSPNLPLVSRIVFICINAVSSLVAVGGNSVILVSFFKIRAFRRACNVFIVSLATTDLLVGLVVNPTYIALTTMNAWFSSHRVYKLENFLWIQCLVASTYALCGISIDRFIAVKSAVRYRQLVTKRRSICCVFVIWISSFAFGLSTLFFNNHYDSSILWILCLVATFILPLGVILYCYFHIFKAANEQKLKIVRLNPAEASEILRNRKAAFTAAIVIGLFFVTFFPNVVFSCIDLSTKDRCEKSIVYRHWLWGIFLAFSSSALNPFVYAARIPEFRLAFKALIVFQRM